MKICQVCGASFVSKGNLKQHMEAIHEKKRDFACNVCDAKFYFKHKMEEHVKGMNLDLFLFLFVFHLKKMALPDSTKTQICF